METILNNLESVICDPEGKCCITGSAADRAIVDSALAELRGAIAQPVEPVDSVGTVRLYNLGDRAGHEDTVEGVYADVAQSDMDSYHAEEVAELIEEGSAIAQPTNTGMEVTDDGVDKYYFVDCNYCGIENKIQIGNHHPWCPCGSDSFDWGNERTSTNVKTSQPVQPAIKFKHGCPWCGEQNCEKHAQPVQPKEPPAST